MGKKEPNKEELAFTRNWGNESEFEKKKSYNDPRFGDIVIYKNKHNNSVMFSKQSIFSSLQPAKAEVTNMLTRRQLNHPNLLKILDYTTEIRKGMCSTSYVVQGLYEYPKSDMNFEYVQHQKNKKAFSST